MFERLVEEKPEALLSGILAVFLLLGALSVRNKWYYTDEESHLLWARELYGLRHRQNLVESQKPLLLFHTLWLPSGLKNERDALFWSRFAVLVWGAVGIVYAFRWSKELFGTRGGLLTAFFLALSPTYIGNARIARADIILATCLTALGYSIWKLIYSENRRVLRASCAGLWLGLLLLSKFSALSLALVTVVALLVWIALEGGRTRKVLLSLGVIGVGWFVVNFAYVFDGSLTPLGELEATSRIVRTLQAGPVRSVPLLLPLLYTEALDAQIHDMMESTKRVSDYFILGRVSEIGWRWYYLAGLLIKSTIAEILVVLVGLVCFATNPRKRQLLPLLFLVVGFLSVGASRSFNYAIAYVLFVYPLGLILAGKALGSKTPLAKPLKIIVPVLFIWQGFSALRAYPDYIAYSNEIFGGVSRTHHSFLGLLDWEKDWFLVEKRLLGSDYIKVVPDYRMGEVSPQVSKANLPVLLAHLLPAADPHEPFVGEGRFGVGAYSLAGTALSSPYKTLLRFGKTEDSIGGSFFVYNLSLDHLPHEDRAIRVSVQKYRLRCGQSVELLSEPGLSEWCRGQALFLSRQYTRAEQVLRRLTAGRIFPEAELLLALSYLQMGLSKRAEPVLHRLIERNFSPPAQFLLTGSEKLRVGLYALYKEQPGSARQLILEAKDELKDYDWLVELDLSAVAVFERDLSRAYEHLRRALRLRPSLELALRLINQLYSFQETGMWSQRTIGKNVLKAFGMSFAWEEI